jgi:hypothetical protein
MSNFIDITIVSLKTFENFKLGELASGSVPGVTIVDRKEINFDDIFFQNDGTNEVREDKANEIAIKGLKEDFATRGWCVGQPLPCVIANDGMEMKKYNNKKYRLVQGHHRTEAMMAIGLDKFVFNIISAKKTGKFSRDSIINLYSLKSNVDHLVQTKATKYDVAKVIAAGISDGTFIDQYGEVDHDGIRNTISMNPDFISFTKADGTLTEIIRIAEQRQGRTDVVIRTQKEFKRALKSSGNSILNKFGKGEYHLFDCSDPTRSYGRMIADYSETGRRQKIVFNINDFQTKNESDLKCKSRKILDMLDNCYNTAIRAYDLSGSGKNIRPKNKIYEVIGFAAATLDELASGRDIIPVDERLKSNLKTTHTTSIKIVGKKVATNKLNKILNVEE